MTNTQPTFKEAIDSFVKTLEIEVINVRAITEKRISRLPNNKVLCYFTKTDLPFYIMRHFEAKDIEGKLNVTFTDKFWIRDAFNVFHKEGTAAQTATLAKKFTK